MQITDNGNMALKWVEHYIRTNVNKKYGNVVKRVDDSYGFRKQFIHFIDRYAYLKAQRQHIEKSNIVALTWLHSNPISARNEDLECLENFLIDSQDNIRHLVTSNDISSKHLEAIGFNKEKIALLPLGVDTQLFCKVDHDKRNRIRLNLGISEKDIIVASLQKDGVGTGEGNEPKLIKGPDISLEVIDQLALKEKIL